MNGNVQRSSRLLVRNGEAIPALRTRIRTPLGIDLLVATDGDAITASDFVARTRAKSEPAPHPLLAQVRLQVNAYFSRRLDRFDVPLALAGTPMQVAIWRFVAQLPFGETISYADVGRALGYPRAHRAVAMAMGRSPFDLFIPAHRVVGADGRIKGAGVGSTRRALLHFEGLFRAVADDAIRSSGRSPRSGRPPRPSR